jgi:hypothetical protein
VHGDQSRCATVDTEQLPMEPHRLLDQETAGKKRQAGDAGSRDIFLPNPANPSNPQALIFSSRWWRSTAAALTSPKFLDADDT